VVHLVSTWPFPVLNLNDVDIPFGDYLQRATPRSDCIADLIIKGLFYRKVKFCRLQMIVLPKDTKEGLNWIRNWSRVATYLIVIVIIIIIIIIIIVCFVDPQY